MGVCWGMFLGKVRLVLQHSSEPRLHKEPGSPLCISQALAIHRAQHCSSKGCLFEEYFSGEGEQ